MSKEEVIKIINDSLDELLYEVGNDYEYNGCSHLVKIIIKRLKPKQRRWVSHINQNVVLTLQ